METRADRLKWTKVYHGEKECPKEIKEDPEMLFFWSAEQDYVENNALIVNSNCVKRYLEANNSGLSYDYPIDLLATLYKHYYHVSYYQSDRPYDSLYCGAKFREECFPIYEQLTSK